MNDPYRYDNEDEIIAEEIADLVYERLTQRIGKSAVAVVVWVIGIAITAIATYFLTWLVTHLKASP
jgi:uncharacterized protein (DUF697 family)